MPRDFVPCVYEEWEQQSTMESQWVVCAFVGALTADQEWVEPPQIFKWVTRAPDPLGLAVNHEVVRWLAFDAFDAAMAELE